MTRRLVFGFALLSLWPAAGAETSQERGKRVMAAVLAAIGGPHYLNMEDRLESGRVYSFYRERLSGLSLAKIYTRYLHSPAPGQLAVREREVFGKKEDNVILFTEDNGYELTFRGARPLEVDLLARYRDTTTHNVFYILRERLEEPGLTFDSRGSDIMDNQPVDIVDITDAENRVVTVYVNHLTKLPSRQVFLRRNAVTRDRDEEVTLFSKYRDVGNGVMWPFAIERARNGEKTFQIFSDTVEINRDLRDNLFSLPANMKVLSRKK